MAVSEATQGILDRLEGVRRSGEGWTARCPAHEDHKPSLTVSEGADGRVLLCCQRGCATEDVVAALGLSLSDLFLEEERAGAEERKDDHWRVVDTYTYEDADGRPSFQVRRTQGKEFPQYHLEDGEWVKGRGDTPSVLYRLPQVIRAVAEGKPILVPEGEKDVQALEKLGFCATCNPGGAGNGRSKWRPEYGEYLRGARVYVLPDNDEPGRRHAESIVNALRGQAAEVRMVELSGLPPKGDVSDWIAAGGCREKLEALVRAGRDRSQVLTSRAATERCLHDLERRRKGEIRGLPWPPEWAGLAKTLGPIEEGTLVVVGARPSVGKTLFAAQLQAFLCDRGYSVLYVTRELTPERLVRRHIAAQGAQLAHLKCGQLTASDQEAIDAYRRRQERWRVVYDGTSTTVADMAAQAVRCQADVVVVDYMQRLAYDMGSEYAELTRIVNDLQNLALSSGVPVVCLSQLSRPIKGQEHRPPTMTDTRGSGAVEERATQIVLLHRNWTTKKSDIRPNTEVAALRLDTGYFIVAKNADGEADRAIPMRVDGARMRIVETQIG